MESADVSKDRDGNETDVQPGQGVFGQCLKKYYKGIPVAVKFFNHLSSSQDVKQEANSMALCYHASIPHIFGVNVTILSCILFLCSWKVLLYLVPCPSQ